jgi:hypothetical protein
MQQRQFTLSPFAAKTLAAAPSVKTAPIALDAATLTMVAGGAQTSGPYGGWSSVAAAGPYGGWGSAVAAGPYGGW